MSQTLVQLTRVNLDDFGVYPGSVNMVSTANLATITTAGYLNNNGYEFFNVNLMPTDIIQCLYSYNQITGVGSYAVFSVDIDDDGIFTLVDQSPSGAYLPLAGGLMTGGIQTAGETISNSALTTLRSTFIYLGVGADTPISPVASNFLYETVTHPVNIYDPSGLADYDEGFFFAIKNVSGGNVTFTPFGSEKIDGASSLTIANQSSVIIAKTSTQWSTVAESNFGGGGIANGGLNAAGQFIISSSTTAGISATTNSWDAINGNLLLGNPAAVISGTTNTILMGDAATQYTVMDAGVAIGKNAFIEGNNTVAIGNGAAAQAINSVAIGNGASTNGASAVAIGNGNNANVANSWALGTGCNVNGTFSVAWANNATVSNSGSWVIGDSHSTPVPDSTTNQWNATFANGFRFFNCGESSFNPRCE